MSEKEEVSQRALDMVQQYLEAAEEVVQSYGPQAADLALMVYRIEALSIVLGGILSLVAGGAIMYAVYRMVLNMEDCSSDIEFPLMMGIIFGGAFGAGGIIAGLICTLNLMAWVGIFHPEVYMLSQVMDKL